MVLFKTADHPHDRCPWGEGVPSLLGLSKGAKLVLTHGLPKFVENRGKLRTVNPTGATEFEPTTSRLSAS